MVNKITNPPSQKDLIDKVNEIIDDKQDTISDLATIRSGASLGATAVQPSTLNDYKNYVNQELNGKQNTLVAGTDISLVTESVLPSGYTELDSIIMNPGSYIDTNITKVDYSYPIIETKFMMLNRMDIDWFGTKTQENGCIIWNLDSSSTAVATYLRYGRKTVSQRVAYMSGYNETILNFREPAVLKTGGSSSQTPIYVNGALVATFGDTTPNFNQLSNSNSILINGSRNRFLAKGRWYYFKIYDENNNVIFNGIPCRRDYDDALGFYDTISETFKGNSGTGLIEVGGNRETIISFTNDSGYITSSALAPYALSADLASVATSGSYNDLSNKPSIPTATSDLTNDSGYITSAALDGYATQNWVENKGYLTEIPAEYVTDSELTAKGYQTAADVETAITTKGYTTMSAVEAKGYITNSALAGYATESYVTTAVGTETTARQNADNNLQSQIDAITASSDVTDIVGTYAELQNYDTSALAPNSIIKVLQDESRNNETTYYRWVITGGVGSWSLIGEEGPYYTIAAADAKFATQTALSTGLSGKQDTISDLATIRSGANAGATAVQPSDLATVATSGSYNDLSNKPTIPAAQVNSDWNATSGVARILNKPTIPTVPTNISAFTNDAGYITNSALTGYATENYVDTGLATKQATLVSGTNIKTVNGNSLLGSGNIVIQAGADIDLSNLSSQGQNIANWSTNVSNCITEIPQDIKLELNNGTLTLKAGSKCYVKGDTTTPTFNITSDKSTTQSTDGSYFAFYDGTNLVTYSKSTYDYSTLPSTTSFPLAEITVSGGAISSIDQVFNGFGYIGSTIFALPNVKGLIPNGRNADGTLKSRLLTLTKVATGSYSGTATLYFGCSGDSGAVYFQSTNIVKYAPETNTTNWGVCIFGSFKSVSGVFSDYTPKTVFHAVDYNDVVLKTDIQVVSALPANPDSDTFYFIPE